MKKKEGQLWGLLMGWLGLIYLCWIGAAFALEGFLGHPKNQAWREKKHPGFQLLLQAVEKAGSWVRATEVAEREDREAREKWKQLDPPGFEDLMSDELDAQDRQEEDDQLPQLDGHDQQMQSDSRTEKDDIEDEREEVLEHEASQKSVANDQGDPVTETTVENEDQEGLRQNELEEDEDLLHRPNPGFQKVYQEDPELQLVLENHDQEDSQDANTHDEELEDELRNLRKIDR